LPASAAGRPQGWTPMAHPALRCYSCRAVSFASYWGKPVTFTVTRFFRLTSLLLACAACCNPDAAAADFKDFRDWLVVCDNLRNCSAYGFEADDPSTAYVSIERGGAPDATARITIAADVDENTKIALAFDDAALRGLPAGPIALDKGDDVAFGRVAINDQATVDALIASLRKAQTLVVQRIDPPGGQKSDPETSKISLSGAVAALLWIDEQQQRLGTATAFIRRGDRPASSIPPPPRAAVIHAARPPAGAAPRALPPAEARMLTAKAKELCSGDEHARLDGTYRLSSDLSLYDFSCPDTSGAYNEASVFLIAPDGKPQAARPVKFVYPAGIPSGAAAAGDAIAINASFDQDTMTLSTFDKGRGLADCGAAEDWVWDGKTFQLVLLRKMPRCKGVASDDWPVHYHAEAK
jgi:hypothetical protein